MVSDPGEIGGMVEVDSIRGLSGDGGAGRRIGVDGSRGTAALGDGVESNVGTVDRAGPIPRDPVTNSLLALTLAWEDLQRVRLGLNQRGMEWAAEGVRVLEDKVARLVTKAVREHPLWPWLSQYPGLGGIHVARVIAIIGDPRRFPGPRSVWHYSGLHVVNGRMPKRCKGVKCDWNPKMRTAFLMPGGICEQIVRLRVPKYRDRYDMEKERLQRERGVAPRAESETSLGPAPAPSEGVEAPAETEQGPGPLRTSKSECGVVDRGVVEVPRGPALSDSEGVESPGELGLPHGSLRPFQVDQRARIIAGKAFLADLWRAWCELLAENDDA